ncbi:MAG: metal-dependent hydrolase, beta-lactamase superfamily [Acidimicrobiales bacterium]|nr:metal-dependent hydrolase, beta-lactamase superfamily [Acidimicrobiales bacterium]
MKVTILGCSGSYAGPGGACSGYLVQGGGVNLWLDAGPGTLANLQRHLDLDAIDGIVLSHAHPDHWVDFLPFHNVVRYIKPRSGLPVWSPRRVQELTEAVNGDLTHALDWTIIDGSSHVELGGLRLSFSRTDHGPETLAVRIDEAGGPSLGYSADTGPGWSLTELGPGLDTALVEASMPVALEGSVQHLSGRQAGRQAADAGVGRLLLTHLQPGVDPDAQLADARAAFGGPVEVATIDTTYEIGTT